MKVLFYSLFNNFLPPFATQLELIKQEQDKGNEIFILKCNGVLDSCHANIKHSIIKCGRCQERADNFSKLLQIPKENVLNFKSTSSSITFNIPDFKNTAELMKFSYDGINIGRGVASNIISRYRDFHVTSEKYHDLIELQLKMALSTYLNGKRVIEEIKPDLIYIYNGRLGEIRPIIQLAQKLGIDYTSYVSGSSMKKYRTFKNSVVHNPNAFQKDLNSTWENAEESTRIKVGRSFFENNRHNTVKNFPSYLDGQTRNKLPENFSSDQTNIAIFNSSEDEQATFDEWKTHLYKEQNQGIEKIVHKFANQKSIHFYLRVHPNLGKVVNKQMEEINNFSFPNLTVIPPDSEVDTYALMDACDKVITFGSTTGVEATYWQKPSILFGKSYYDHLDCVYQPNSVEELNTLIMDKNLKAKPKANALKYGYYVLENGTNHQFADIRDVNDVYFMKKNLGKISINTFIYILKNLPDLLKHQKLNKLYDQYES